MKYERKTFAENIYKRLCDFSRLESYFIHSTSCTHPAQMEQATVGATGLGDTLQTAYRLNRLIIDATILQRNGSQQTVAISFTFGESNHRNRVDISNKHCTRKYCTLHGKVKGFKMWHNTNCVCVCVDTMLRIQTHNSLKNYSFVKQSDGCLRKLSRKKCSINKSFVHFLISNMFIFSPNKTEAK